MNPVHPVYVISKGRADTRFTSKALEEINVPYRIVIEPQEYDAYSAVIDPAKILVLPFSNLGLGSIPARNWVWEHSINEGHDWHWILDDNITWFLRMNNNMRILVSSGTIFRVAEMFVDRYENIGQAGFNYYMFCPDNSERAPYYLNTRIYSCILNRNHGHEFRWRGRYNEDTDLSLRILKAGWCTVLFNAFLARKLTTMTLKGGNTEELYKLDGKKDGRLLMAESLREQHPDIVTVTRKWNRYQHQVYYGNFKQRLIRKKNWGYKGVNNFGMQLKNIQTGEIL